MRAERFYAVDRLQRKFVVVVGDDDETREVSREVLPAQLREGDVLRVPLVQGELDWASAWVDEDETERRRREAQQLLDRLRRRDPGGDVEL
jgi:hypothetical protein